MIHMGHIFSKMAVEKNGLDISRKNQGFHIFFAYGLLLLKYKLSSPLSERETGGLHEIFL